MMGNALLNWISDLLWPLTCLGCGRRDIRLCESCLADTDEPSPVVPRPFPCVDRLLAAGTMRSPVLARAVWHLKYRNAPDLAVTLGDQLAAAAASAGLLPARDTVVVPVPLHPSRLRERGYNQAGLLAARLATVALLPLHSRALMRSRRTTSQVTTADRAERLENMVGAFACTDPALVRGRAVFLIDDVCTTGATLSACAVALKDAGARNVTAIVLAR
jgi:ComF family protein